MKTSTCKIKRGKKPCIYEDFSLFYVFKNVVWKSYPEIFLIFLFSSLGW